MLSKKLAAAINEQINAELWSGYLYLSMSTYFEDKGLSGMAHWMRHQAEEEQEHAMKFYKYMVERGERVLLKAIDAVETEFTGIVPVFEETLKHEQLVTSLINNLYSIAVDDKDYASQSFLNWYVDEQVEEEKNASQILDVLGKIGSSAGGLYQLDHQLGKRKGD